MRPSIFSPLLMVKSDFFHVRCPNSPAEFIQAAMLELSNASKEDWLKRSDAFLAGNSWNETWHRMQTIISSALKLKQPKSTKKLENYV